MKPLVVLSLEVVRVTSSDSMVEVLLNWIWLVAGTVHPVQGVEPIVTLGKLLGGVSNM